MDLGLIRAPGAEGSIKERSSMLVLASRVSLGRVRSGARSTSRGHRRGMLRVPRPSETESHLEHFDYTGLMVFVSCSTEWKSVPTVRV